MEVLVDKGPTDRLEAAVRFVEVRGGKTPEPRGLCERDGDLGSVVGHGGLKEALNLGGARSKIIRRKADALSYDRAKDSR